MPHVTHAQTDASHRPHLSVIVPTLNEATTIVATLRHVIAAPSCEVIVVDGGSKDATVSIARASGAHVITAPPGRASQMNAGARVARGKAFLFLHADTVLPEGVAGHVERALAQHGVVAGAFRFRLPGSHLAYRIIARCVNWRSRVLRLPYGDQALFMSAEIFRDVGGYPPIPIMEDVAMVERLRRLGRIALAPAGVITSDRRMRAVGVWRMTLINLACLAAYKLGVSPARIAAWRNGKGSDEPGQPAQIASR